MSVRILEGDALQILRTLPDQSVQCCVTSPPYFGLRDYGVVGQLGLEKTPQLYVDAMVGVFSEVKRVLRDDGTLWLNIGDSYAGGGGGEQGRSGAMVGRSVTAARVRTAPRVGGNGLKPKDLIGIPWMLAFALRADGWYLRSDIIWHKPNPMPESVTDRPTKAHEYLFLFAKGQSWTRTIAFSDVEPERIHFGQDFGKKCATVRDTTRLCIDLATSFFYAAQSQRDFSLPPFYSEVWKQRPEGEGSSLIADLPPIHRMATHSARFLNADASAKEFLREMHGLWSDLGDSDHLLICRALSECVDSPCVLVDGNAAIAINYAGKPSKIEFLHQRIVVTVPTTCNYYYDADAIAEPFSDERMGNPGTYKWKQGAHGIAGGGPNSLHKGNGIVAGWNTDGSISGRNRRSVWTVNTSPYSEAHFATFPPKLIEPCILAGSAKQVCEKCGAPWGRDVERTAMVIDRSERTHEKGRTRSSGTMLEPPTSRTLGFSPTCDCANSGTARSLVLDPFGGAGTTGLVADRLGRDALLIELNPKYAEMARKRIQSDNPLFTDVA